MIAATFVESMAGVGVVVGAAVGIIALGEKVTGLLGRWVRRQVSEVIAPTEARVKHHLGENGDTVPVHQRIAFLEGQVGGCPHVRGEREVA